LRAAIGAPERPPPEALRDRVGPAVARGQGGI